MLGAYGKGSRPLVKGGGTRDQSGAVELRNQKYWTIQDLRITNTVGGRSSKYYRSGVLLVNSAGGRLPGITVRRLDIRSVASNMSLSHGDPRLWGGVSALTYGRSGSNGFDGLTIRDNTIARLGRTGVIVNNANYPRSADRWVRVAGNRIDRTRGDGIVVRGTVSARIDHNRVSRANSAWPCPECGRITPATANAAIWTAASKRTRIDHNEAYLTKMKGGDGEGFDIDVGAVDTVMEYNYSHDNEGGGVLFYGSTDATARFNIFENNQKSAFAFIGTMPAKNTKIYNNTVYNSPKSRARVVRYFNGAHGGQISFKNNLLYNYSYASYLWPTKKVATSANTLVGLHSTRSPKDARTSRVDPGLRQPGSGRAGMTTL